MSFTCSYITFHFNLILWQDFNPASLIHCFHCYFDLLDYSVLLRVLNPILFQCQGSAIISLLEIILPSHLGQSYDLPSVCGFTPLLKDLAFLEDLSFVMSGCFTVCHYPWRILWLILVLWAAQRPLHQVPCQGFPWSCTTSPRRALIKDVSLLWMCPG